MTNNQSVGYVLLAREKLDINKEQDILNSIHSKFDCYTEQEAQAFEFNWLYNDN